MSALVGFSHVAGDDMLQSVMEERDSGTLVTRGWNGHNRETGKHRRNVTEML